MSVLVMESDRDMRKLGDELDGIVKSKANGDTLRAHERRGMPP